MTSLVIISGSVYAASTVASYLSYCYSDGKEALDKHRDQNKPETDELKTIKNSINYCNNFWEALIFPWTTAGKIIPRVILYRNPRKKDILVA